MELVLLPEAKSEEKQLPQAQQVVPDSDTLKEIEKQVESETKKGSIKKNLIDIKDKIKELTARSVNIGIGLSIADVFAKASKTSGLVDEKWANYTAIEVMNNLNKDSYAKTASTEKILLLPHCLRRMQVCKATFDEDGWHCKHCGACSISLIQEKAEAKGIKTFVLSGGSMVKKIIMKHQPKAILGVACFNEIKMGSEALGEVNVPHQAVLLKKDGCVNTEVDANEVIEKLEL